MGNKTLFLESFLKIIIYIFLFFLSSRSPSAPVSPIAPVAWVVRAAQELLARCRLLPPAAAAAAPAAGLLVTCQNWWVKRELNIPGRGLSGSIPELLVSPANKKKKH